MGLTEYQAEVIELLAQHEETIGEFYRINAKKFSEKKQFWTVLHLEELEHASWIRRIRAQVDEGLLAFNKGRFKIKQLCDSLDFIKGQLKRAKTADLSLKQALSTALNMEESVIESKFFEVYATDSQELKQLLGALEDSYKEHRNRLKQALDKATTFL